MVVLTLILIAVAVGVGMLLGARLSTRRAGERPCRQCGEQLTMGRHNARGRTVDPILRALLAEQRRYAP